MATNRFSDKNKNMYFGKQVIDSLIYGIESIKLLSNLNDDLQNTKLYTTIKIIFICYQLNKLVEMLPQDDFKDMFKNALSLELKKYSCYRIDAGNQINCLDFYSDFVKRKNVNSQILKTVKLQKGGMSIMITAAVTALAIISASVSVSGAVFNSDKFLDQQFAKQGLDPKVRQETSLFSSVKSSILSGFQTVETPNHVLSKDEVKSLNLMNYNNGGTCTYLAYIAELCSGGCPTQEQWLERDPNIVQEIINSQSFIDESEYLQRQHVLNKYDAFLSEPDILPFGSRHMLGVGLSAFTRTEPDKPQPTRVPSYAVSDPEWFREHFRSGDLDYNPDETTSDLAIATVFSENHAFNLLYNRNNQKLCIHEVNNDSDADFFIKLRVKSSYFCEKDFFEPDKLKWVNSIGIINIIDEVDDKISIFTASGNDHIRQITPKEQIFMHDNQHNSGSIHDYLDIHKQINDAIIRGSYESYEIMKQNEDKLGLDSDVVNAYGLNIHNKEKLIKNPYNKKEYLASQDKLAQYARNIDYLYPREEEPLHVINIAKPPPQAPPMAHSNSTTRYGGKRKFTRRKVRRLTNKKKRKSKIFVK
jgi:hypothetical protein